MTPGNYCTHAIESIRELRDITRSVGRRAFADDAAYLDMLQEDLGIAEKFLLPNTGRLLDPHADVHSMLGNLRLPFERVVAEYQCVHDSVTGPKLQAVQTLSTRRVVYCLENNAKQGYWVTTVDWIDGTRTWEPCPLMIWIDYDQHAHSSKNWEYNGKSWAGKFEYKLVMPEMIRRSAKQLGLDMQHKIELCLQETLWDWQAIVHLTNFLACSNTYTEPLPPSPKLNKKRAEAGRVPLYTYKVLKVSAQSRHNARSATGSSAERSRQRWHVRRGHIRHYGPNENREDVTKRAGYTKWIQQYGAGDPSLGTIEKDYEIV